MKNINDLSCPITIIIMAFISVGMASSMAVAQEWSRKGKGEVYVFGQFIGGDETSADAFGEEFTMDFDDTFGGGLGIGYNLNDHFNINGDFFYAQPDVEGRGFDTDVESETDMSGFDMNLDLNILKSRLTPLITAGFGWINFSGDFEGYDFDETDLSYNIGGGIRWDVTNHLLIKAVYRSLWTEIEDTDDALRFDVIALSIGYMF